MKLLLTAMGVLALVLCFGQNGQTPSELVNTAKTKGQTFEKATLFKPAQQGASDRSLKVSSYQTLDLEEEALAQLILQAEEAISLELPAAKDGKALKLQLVKVDLYAPGFAAILASTGRTAKRSSGIHYRGTIAGESGSVAAVSLYEGKVMGLISAPGMGNLVLGKLKGARNTGRYVLYDDRDVLQELHFNCSTSDEGPDYRPEQLEAPAAGRSQDNCVNIYLEVDYDIYQDKGGATGTVNYVTGLFNEVATLYANENINLRLSEIHLWDTPSPYYGTSSYALLTQFVNERPTFNGDLGQLLSYQASGGIAYLSGLCSNYSPRHSFSSINSTYAIVPTYSFSAMVVTHELGHLFGSRHTHACAWNGNNTAIDGCAGFVEGNCPTPGYPESGGTIMSYCHLRSVGINFSHGFGVQPGNVIRNAVINAACLSACEVVSEPGEECEGQEVSLRLVLDQYGIETTWEVRDSNDDVIHSGGPYPNSLNGTVITESLCLKEGCFTFEVFDEFGDGMCCDFGEGSYELLDTNNVVLAEGGAFTNSESTAFCLPMEVDSSDCFAIDFADYEIESFGGVQDAGTYQLLQNEEQLKISDNAWKAILLEYEVTPHTVIEFEFKSTRQGEIHGIGFDDNSAISANRTFRLYGYQNWGYGAYDNYQYNDGWKQYTIPVGEFYTGRFDWLFFVADHDRYPSNGNSYYRNIKIYEGEGCVSEATSPIITDALPKGGQEKTTTLTVFPNPVSDLLTLDYLTPQAGPVHIQAFNMTGQLAFSRQMDVLPGHQRSTIDVSGWPAGTYVLKLLCGKEQLLQRVVVDNR